VGEARGANVFSVSLLGRGLRGTDNAAARVASKTQAKGNASHRQGAPAPPKRPIDPVHRDSNIGFAFSCWGQRVVAMLQTSAKRGRALGGSGIDGPAKHRDTLSEVRDGFHGPNFFGKLRGEAVGGPSQHNFRSALLQLVADGSNQFRHRR
jgi:hypothetical protein